MLVKKTNKESSFISWIVKLILLTTGAFIAGFGLEGFLIPNSMIDGGIVGISIMLSYLTKINLGILLFCLNLPFIFLALKKLGRIFVVQTAYAITMLSLSVNVFHKMHVTDDLLLATVFGGVVLGLGVGLILRSNAALDGTEILAIKLAKKAGFSIGEIIMFFNFFIYTAAGFLFGWDRAMYSILVYFIAYKVIDIVLEGLNESKSVTIISNRAEKIGEEIIKRLDVGVTYLSGKGGYTGEDKKIIYCVISRLELVKLKELVNLIDKQSFIAIENVHEVEGVRIKQKRAGKKK
ncbi:MAG TPA: YitT family protein [Candidatus Gastranaerophilaceae bacterium]|nr:YitT family protein [Candidatus Gastranaerophilaceae bacterium]HPT41702.1 YitT family protein [Candidatus Gastranaerophilaceae bacterium]